jgi:hypothetical protein
VTPPTRIGGESVLSEMEMQPLRWLRNQSRRMNFPRLDEVADELEAALTKAEQRVEELEGALERLANPKHRSRWIEGQLVQDEVVKIARAALSSDTPPTRRLGK